MQTNDTTLNTAGDDSQLDDGRTIEGGITEVKPLDHSLAVLNPDLFAKTLFEPDFEKLGTLKRSASRAKVDIATTAGMAKAQEFETAFVKVRTGGDKKKTEFKKPLDQAGKKILEQYNALAEAAKAEEKKWTDLITAEKTRLANIEAEKQRLERVRIEAIEGRIEHLRKIPSMFLKAPADEIAVMVDKMVETPLDPADYEEHLEIAIGAQNVAINELRQLLVDARERENRDAELARLRAEDEKRKEAAAATQRQQEQMTSIMEMQGLANALMDAGQADDRQAIEAAVKKAREFDPASYGAMAPMAELARDAAVKQLEQLRADLPAPVVVTDLTAPGADGTVTVDIEADHTGVVIGQAVLSTEASPVKQALASAGTFLGLGARLVPKTKRPADLDILELVASHYGVPSMTAHAWLATFDAEAVRAALAGA